MPQLPSCYYSITFRPTIKEFEKYREDFVDLFTTKFKEEKYVISPEKAEKDFINHYQIYLEFNTEKRPDTIKKTINVLYKSYELSYRDVALKVKPIKNNVENVIGYTLKEQDEKLNDVISNFDSKFLNERRLSYLQFQKDKVASFDKVRVNVRTLPEIFKRYVENNHDRLLKDYNLNGKYNFTEEDVKIILLDMGQKEYQMLPIVISKDIKKIIKYLQLFIREKLVDERNDLYS